MHQQRMTGRKYCTVEIVRFAAKVRTKVTAALGLALPPVAFHFLLPFSTATVLV
jgi:hypothetical protein